MQLKKEYKITSPERKKTGIVNSTAEVRSMIMDNPKLPIVYFVNEKVPGYEYGWYSCSKVDCRIGEILDCNNKYTDGNIMMDKRDFRDAVVKGIYNNETEKLSDEEYDDLVDSIVAQYDKYWTKSIIVEMYN